MAAAQARLRRHAPGLLPGPRRAVRRLEDGERPRGGGWMQGLLAALRQHRRPRGRARDLSLHAVHLVRVLLPEREGGGGARARGPAATAHAVRHAAVHLAVLHAALRRGQDQRPAPRARSAQVQRHEGVLPRVRQQVRARRLPRGSHERTVGRERGAVRAVPRPDTVRPHVRPARGTLRVGGARRPVPLRVGAPGRFRRPLVQRDHRGGDLHAVDGEDAGVWGTGRAAWGQAGTDGGARGTGLEGEGRRDRRQRDVGDLRRRRRGHGHRRRRRARDHRVLARAARVPGPRRDQGRALHGRRRRETVPGQTRSSSQREQRLRRVRARRRRRSRERRRDLLRPVPAPRRVRKRRGGPDGRRSRGRRD